MRILGITLIILGMSANVWGKCEESYIPPHEYQDLVDVKNWAAGKAFAQFAKKAGVVFDVETYINDNPYPALANFGAATGFDCLKFDVTTSYVSHLSVLTKYHYKVNHQDEFPDENWEEKETFTEFYLRLAEKAGIMKYISYANDWA